MTRFNKEALLEAFKELLRTAILAVIPLIIAGLSSEGGVAWKAVGVAGAIAFLSGVDKLLHEKGIETPLDLKGIQV